MADNIGLDRKAADTLIDSAINRKDRAQQMFRESTLNDDMKRSLTELIKMRCERLK